MEFRKLEIELPTQPVVNQKPFAIGGWLLAIAVLLLIALAYWYEQ
jgi:hypothetical protein